RPQYAPLPAADLSSRHGWRPLCPDEGLVRSDPCERSPLGRAAHGLPVLGAPAPFPNTATPGHARRFHSGAFGVQAVTRVEAWAGVLVPKRERRLGIATLSRPIDCRPRSTRALAVASRRACSSSAERRPASNSA